MESELIWKMNLKRRDKILSYARFVSTTKYCQPNTDFFYNHVIGIYFDMSKFMHLVDKGRHSIEVTCTLKIIFSVSFFLKLILSF